MTRLASNVDENSAREVLFYISCLLIITAILGPVLPGIPIRSYSLFPYRLLIVFVYIPSLVYLFAIGAIQEVELSPAALYFGIFYLYLIISSIWTSGMLTAVTSLLVLLFAVLLTFTLVLTVQTEFQLRLCMTLLLLIVVSSLGIAGWEQFTGTHLTTSRIGGLPDRPPYTYRMSAWYHNSNDFSFFLTICSSLPLLNALSSRKRPQYRFVNLAVFVLIIAVVSTNGSRTAILAELLIVGICTVLYFGRTRLNAYRQYFSGFFTLLVILGSIAVIIAIHVLENPISRNTSFSLWTRWRLLTIAKRIAVDTWMGVGVGNFAPTVSYLSIRMGGIEDPHSWLAWLLGTTGVFGTAIFLFAYGQMLDDLFQDYLAGGDATSLALFASMAAFFVGGLGPSNVFQLQIFWIFLGLSLAKTRLLRS